MDPVPPTIHALRRGSDSRSDLGARQPLFLQLKKLQIGRSQLVSNLLGDHMACHYICNVHCACSKIKWPIEIRIMLHDLLMEVRPLLKLPLFLSKPLKVPC